MYVDTIPNTFHAIVVILCAPGHDINLANGFEWTGRNRELKQHLLGICEGQRKVMLMGVLAFKCLEVRPVSVVYLFPLNGNILFWGKGALKELIKIE